MNQIKVITFLFAFFYSLSTGICLGNKTHLDLARISISDLPSVSNHIKSSKTKYYLQADLLHSSEQKIGTVKSGNRLENNLILKDQQLKELEADARKNAIYMLVVIIGLLGLFIVFVYRKYVQDIKRMNEIKNHNTTILSNTKKIAAQNEELRKFAYVASHDLKAPLRGIVNISEWLARDYAQHLDPRGAGAIYLDESKGS